MNQWDEAIAECRKAIEFDAKCAPAHSLLGCALSFKNQWDEAIAELRKAIDLDPKDEPAHFNLGGALMVKN
jgi:Flp pilus assembly protein TadD